MKNLVLLKNMNTHPFSFFEDFERDSFKSDYDFIENENHYLLSIDLPGVKRSDVNLTVKDNILAIEAVRKTANTSSTFKRSFTLPEDINQEKVDSYCEDGVLSIIFAKKESSKAKTISLHDSKNKGMWSKLSDSIFPEKSLPEKAS